MIRSATRSLVLLLPLFALALPLAAQVQSAGDFRMHFAKAVVDDDFGRQKSLVAEHKDYVRPAWNDFESEWCAASVEGSGKQELGAKLDKILEQLAFLNKIENRDDYLVERLTWLRGLKDDAKVAKAQFWNDYARAYGPYSQAMKSRTEDKMRAVVEMVLPMAESIEKAGDMYWAANAYHMIAQCYEIIPEYWLAAYYCAKAIRLGRDRLVVAEFGRQNADLRLARIAKDGRIKADAIKSQLPIEEAKAEYDKILANPLGQPGQAGPDGKPVEVVGVKPEDVPPMPNVGHGKIEWEDATKLKVAPLKRDPKYRTPYFAANAHWLFWPGVGLTDSQTATFSSLPGGAEIIRDGSKILIDIDGQESRFKPTRLKLSAKAKLQTFKNVKYVDGSTGTVYHMMMEEPTEYKINGFAFSTSGKVKGVRVKGATLVTGKIRGEDVTIHDLNANGAFNDFGKDCIVVGKGRKAKVQPLSKFMVMNDLMYEFRVEANGLTIRTRPYDGPVTLLKVDYQCDTMPEFLVAQGSGDMSTAFVNLLEAIEKPIWVVPGSYEMPREFAAGYMIKGKGDRAETMIIAKGRSGIFNVGVGQLNTWELGGAGKTGFSFGFKTETRKERGQQYIVIPGMEVKVYGNFGEEYLRSTMGTPFPKVMVRRGKDGPIWFRGEMRKPERADYEKDGDAVWFPKPLEIKKTVGGDYSVKMELDWKPLGKIASDWVAGS